MGKNKGRRARLKFFDRGNTRCPICLIPFTKKAVVAGLDVTLEHVPPKTLDGTVRCLTCSDCNRSAGQSLDQAVGLSDRTTRDREAGRGVRVELDVFGTKHTTFFSPDGIAKIGLDSKLASSTNMKNFLGKMSGHRFHLLTEMKRGPIWDVSKGITLTIKRPRPNHTAVSWLRSAYLLVFSLLGRSGYRYAESEAIRPIREQIMNPDDELLPWLLCDVSRLRLPNELIIMNNWKQLFCWIVKVGSMGVFLPHGSTSNHCREVLKMPDQIVPTEFRGWHPAAFGKSVSCELTLHEDSTHANADLFGHELTIPSGELERQCIVVNQQGLVCTIMPFGPTRRRS